MFHFIKWNDINALFSCIYTFFKNKNGEKAKKSEKTLYLYEDYIDKFKLGYSALILKTKKVFNAKKPSILMAFYFYFQYENYSISETLMVLTIPLSLIGIAARLIK